METENTQQYVQGIKIHHHYVVKTSALNCKFVKIKLYQQEQII